jgi:hypothetical protein
MFTLYHRGGRFELLEPSLSDDDVQSLIRNAIELLRARGESTAADLLQCRRWGLSDATNDFGDEFSVLTASVRVREYEELRRQSDDIIAEHHYQTIAEVLSEIGPYVRYVACRLDRSALVTPVDALATDALAQLDSDEVHRVWRRALERLRDDPEGAITVARTLLESVCRHILEDLGVPADDGSDLPLLYRRTSEQLRLHPTQHAEDVFRRILGGCTSVVEGLGALRNRLSDAHGAGPRRVRPARRHAELAVNLAGSMATFLVATYEARRTEAT